MWLPTLVWGDPRLKTALMALGRSQLETRDYISATAQFLRVATEFPRDPYEGSRLSGFEPLPGAPAFTPWDFRPDAGWAAEFDLVGYHIEAADGSIGKVAESSHALGASFLVADTGPWIFGRKIVIPAGVVTHIDHTDRRIYLDRTKDQVKESPEYDNDLFRDPAYRDKVGAYYGDTYQTR